MRHTLNCAILAAVLGSAAFAQPEFTMAQYNNVRLGMKYSEVCRILGVEGEQASLMKTGGLTTAAYRWRGGDVMIIGVFQSRMLGPLSGYGIWGSMVLKSKQQIPLPRVARVAPPVPPQPEPENAAHPAPLPEFHAWDVLETSGNMADSNGSVGHYEWKIVVRNNTDADLTLSGDVDLVDQDGHAVDTAKVMGLRISARADQELTGSKMVMADAAIAGVKAVLISRTDKAL